ncbi:hypothetical protein QQF64_036476 [Cirrhinus molitorella]|uniref:Uncharacterized protein n=1 Tax=Cirrhinus molitorella TaxID=172907 RepID=A0ABR3NIN4_9TELE
MTIPYGWPQHPMMGRVEMISPSVPMTFIYGSRSPHRWPIRKSCSRNEAHLTQKSSCLEEKGVCDLHVPIHCDLSSEDMTILLSPRPHSKLYDGESRS